MTALEAYKKFLLKLNKNDTNTKIKISKGEFVLIFNEQKRVWLHTFKKKVGTSDEITELQDLLRVDEILQLVDSKTDKDFFKLPERYFRIQNTYSIAKKGDCERILFNFPYKPKNYNAILQNSNLEPDFDFEQTLFQVTENNLLVHKRDFEIIGQYMTYYREPVDIDLEGYIKIDGSQSKNIDPDMSDENVDRVLNLCVVEATISYENAENLQMSAQRLAINN